MLSTRQTVQTFLLSELFQADKYLDITFFFGFLDLIATYSIQSFNYAIIASSGTLDRWDAPIIRPNSMSLACVLESLKTRR
jgi:hypothetical protein